MARPEWIEVGRIARPHGVHGEVRITPDSDNPERFAPGSVLYARTRQVGIAGPRLQDRVRLTIRTVRGEDHFPIVAFSEISDREGADALHGCMLEVHSSELPELDDDEFYPFDLVGLEVRDKRGMVAGRVSDVVESPAHPILVVALISGGEAMIPFVRTAVPSVDISGGYLTVAPGFLGEGS